MQYALHLLHVLVYCCIL